MNASKTLRLSRRIFLKRILKGLTLFAIGGWPRFSKSQSKTTFLNNIYWIKEIPDLPFYLAENQNCHAGVDTLLKLMGINGLLFNRE